MKKWNRKRSIIVCSVIAFVLLTCFFLWKFLGKEEVVPEYVFYYADNQPEDYPTTLGGKYFAELVEERTEGRIRILVRPGGELGTETEVLKQLKYGGIDFTRVSSLTAAEHLPELNVLSAPYLYTDSEHMWSILDGELGDRFLKMTEDEELIGLSWDDGGVRNFYSMGGPMSCLGDM